MLARETAKALASVLTLSSCRYCATISDVCAAVVFDGRPSVLPSLFARARPACVRSTSRSHFISATAANMVSNILPPGDARSSFSSCRTITDILRAASSLTMAPTSWTSRPSRSSFDKMRVSPFRIWPSSAGNGGRWLALVSPLIASAIQNRSGDLQLCSWVTWRCQKPWPSSPDGVAVRLSAPQRCSLRGAVDIIVPVKHPRQVNPRFRLSTSNDRIDCDLPSQQLRTAM
jgi:hypothetical protein